MSIREFEFELVDVSLGGCRVKSTSNQFRSCPLLAWGKVLLPLRTGVVEVHARVAMLWQRDGHAGVSFHRITERDTLQLKSWISTSKARAL